MPSCSLPLQADLQQANEKGMGRENEMEKERNQCTRPLRKDALILALRKRMARTAYKETEYV
jgi:hypothetical protein